MQHTTLMSTAARAVIGQSQTEKHKHDGTGTYHSIPAKCHTLGVFVVSGSEQICHDAVLATCVHQSQLPRHHQSCCHAWNALKCSN